MEWIISVLASRDKWQDMFLSPIFSALNES
jgi:hypothetical protein